MLHTSSATTEFSTSPHARTRWGVKFNEARLSSSLSQKTYTSTAAAVVAKGSTRKTKNTRALKRCTWDTFSRYNSRVCLRMHFTLFYSDDRIIKTRLRPSGVSYFRWRFVDSYPHNIVYYVTSQPPPPLL